MVAVNVSGLTLCVWSLQLLRLRMQSTQISYYGDGINYDNASLFNQGVIFLYVRTRMFVLFTCGSPAVPVEIIPYDG